jgi:putative FmdB family regulatory protein
MPVYEYRCTQCGERFEVFVRSAQQSGCPSCPKCGSSLVEKALSLFGLGGASRAGSATADSSCGPGPV